MARELNFSPLSSDEAEILQEQPTRNWRRNRREANPTIQMSVRMPEDVYERFRTLCAKERRTNGDMLSVLLGSYLEQQKEKSV